MAKIKIHRDYGVTPHGLLYDPTASMKARGIYGYIQAKPDDWDFSAESIAAESADGRESIQTWLRELEKLGWLERIKSRNTHGQWSIEYILHSASTVTGNPSPSTTGNQPRHRDGKSVDGKPVNNKRNSNKEIISISTNVDIEKSEISDIEKKYWNQEITEVLEFLKKAVGVDDFKNSSDWQRRYARHFHSLVTWTKTREGIWKEEFAYRLKEVLADKYKVGKCNDIRYLYEEIKAFIRHPVVPITNNKNFVWQA